MAKTIEGEDRGDSVKKRGRPAKLVLNVTNDVAEPTGINLAAQCMALRIWDGQSPDVSTIERVARVVKALQDQGLSLDITLPHPDAERHLEAHK